MVYYRLFDKVTIDVMVTDRLNVKINKRTQKNINKAVQAYWYRQHEVAQTQLWLKIILEHPTETTRVDGLSLTVDTRMVRSFSSAKLDRINHHLKKAIAAGLGVVFGQAASINFNY